MVNGKDIRDLEFRLPKNDLKIGVDQAKDFEFSRENAATLDLGFDESVRKPAKRFRQRRKNIQIRDPIAAGQKRVREVHIRGNIKNGRKRSRSLFKEQPIKKGADVIRKGLRRRR